MGNEYANRYGKLPEATEVGSLEVKRFIVNQGTNRYLVIAVPMNAWKHPYRFMVFEDQGGNPGRVARVEPSEWRRIVDAINLELGFVTERYANIARTGYHKERRA